MLLLQKRNREALQHLQTGLALRPSQPALRFFTGLALLLQEEASEAVEKEAALFLQQGLEHVIAQSCNTENNYSGLEPSVTDPLSSVRTQFLRGCLTLGALQQKNTLSQKPMSSEQVYHTVAVLAARGVCRCVCRDEVAQQLEWVLLDAHFALLQSLIQQKKAAGLTQGQGKQGETERQAWVAKRCQALTGLIRLTSIPACRELMDMQEKVCQVAVVTTPRDSHALCLLGLAQLAQCDNDHGSQRLEGAIANACLSFQASIELEDKPQSGEPPTQLTKQQWWQDRLAADKEKAVKGTASQGAGGGGSGPPDTAVAAGRGCGRGMGGPARGGTAAAAKTPTRGGKTAPPAKNTPSTAPPAKNTPSTAPPAKNTPSTAPPKNTPSTAPPAKNTPSTAPPAKNTPSTAPPAKKLLLPLLLPLQPKTPSTAPPAKNTPSTAPPAKNTPSTAPPAKNTPSTAPPAKNTPSTAPPAKNTPSTPKTPFYCPSSQKHPSTALPAKNTPLLPLQPKTPPLLPLQPKTPPLLPLQPKTPPLLPFQPPCLHPAGGKLEQPKLLVLPSQATPRPSSSPPASLNQTAPQAQPNLGPQKVHDAYIELAEMLGQSDPLAAVEVYCRFP
uniref:nascent polypeptide-associated complex subunit alpha, muscle-specific form-like n=1 Tax=Oncorhynchus gorbuscha TaxID=8017 RepID=UPI001EAED0B1|nr:nascent polypeptide-associated complex subunit alpha, muscle-specific form-like [Oncorhynchus gorbuscha]